MSHLGQTREEIALGKRAAWALHQWRRSLSLGGKAMARERVEELIRWVDDVVDALKETGVH